MKFCTGSDGDAELQPADEKLKALVPSEASMRRESRERRGLVMSHEEADGVQHVQSNVGMIYR